MTNAFYRTGLTGGAVNDLDGVSGLAVAGGEVAMVLTGDRYYFYKLDASSGLAENSPRVVKPDTSPGDKRWILQDTGNASAVNDIGVPGMAGFGVGVCPEAYLPPGFTACDGYSEQTHNNYGNYQFSDGSIMCYVPAFFYKIGTGSNGLAVNVVDIKPWSDYATEAEANTDGYCVHLAFKDGGDIKLGFFVDKYMCSKNALGTGHVASSIALGLPLSTHADHNPIADLTACSVNTYYEAVTAAHARDGADGAVNPTSMFFVKSQFIQSALAMFSMAHGQASASATYCAWYYSAGTTNYPKGCNNNTLGDVDDATIDYTSDGHSNCGKTGSGVPFAKTTHNGQACGVADLNGLMYEISIGVTCIATTKNITAVTAANPCQLTVVGHGKSTGDYTQVGGVGGMTEINDKIFTITVVDADNITLDGVDSSAFAAYTSGGTVFSGNFYKAKESVEMASFTSGNTLATDHWGAVGVAAMMDEFDMTFKTIYPNNGFTQRMGSGANQVLSESLIVNAAVLTSLGVPKNSSGVDTAGTNLFGKDYFYQSVQNELCVRSGGLWYHGSGAGVWGSGWGTYRSYSSVYVGFRCCTYAQ